MAVVLTLHTDDANITASVEGQPLAVTASAGLPDLARLQADPYTAGRAP